MRVWTWTSRSHKKPATIAPACNPSTSEERQDAETEEPLVTYWLVNLPYTMMSKQQRKLVSNKVVGKNPHQELWGTHTCAFTHQHAHTTHIHMSHIKKSHDITFMLSGSWSYLGLMFAPSIQSTCIDRLLNSRHPTSTHSPWPQVVGSLAETDT